MELPLKRGLGLLGRKSREPAEQGYKIGLLLGN